MERPQWVLLPERIRYGMYLQWTFHWRPRSCFTRGNRHIEHQFRWFGFCRSGCRNQVMGRWHAQFEWWHVEHGFAGNTNGGTFNFSSGTLKTTDTDQSLIVTSSNFQFSNGTTFNATATSTPTLGSGQHIEIAGGVTIYLVASVRRLISTPAEA